MIISFNNLNAHTYEQDGIEIIHPWCTPSIKGDMSNCSLTISNDNESAIFLKSINSVHINHIMIMKDGNTLKKLEIPASGIRGEDDFNIMLHGTKMDLEIGKFFEANVIFNSSRSIVIKFVIGQDTMLNNTSKEDNSNKDSHGHH